MDVKYFVARFTVFAPVQDNRHSQTFFDTQRLTVDYNAQFTLKSHPQLMSSSNMIDIVYLFAQNGKYQTQASLIQAINYPSYKSYRVNHFCEQAYFLLSRSFGLCMNNFILMTNIYIYIYIYIHIYIYIYIFIYLFIYIYSNT